MLTSFTYLFFGTDIHEPKLVPRAVAKLVLSHMGTALQRAKCRQPPNYNN